MSDKLLERMATAAVEALPGYSETWDDGEPWLLRYIDCSEVDMREVVRAALKVGHPGLETAPDGLALARSLRRWLMTDVEDSHVGPDDVRVYHLDGAVLQNLLTEARALIAKATGA